MQDLRPVLLPAAAAGAVGALVAIYVGGEAETRLRIGHDRQGAALVSAVAGVAQEALAAKNPFLLVSSVGRVARLPYVRAVWVADSDGRIAAHGESDRSGEPADRALLERLRGVREPLAVLEPGGTLHGVCLRAGEGVLGYAAVSLSEEWVVSAAGDLQAILWGGALLLACAAGGAGLATRRSVRRARESLVAAAVEAERASASGDIERVTVARDDEWGDAERQVVEAFRRIARNPPRPGGESP